MSAAAILTQSEIVTLQQRLSISKKKHVQTHLLSTYKCVNNRVCVKTKPKTKCQKMCVFVIGNISQPKKFREVQRLRGNKEKLTSSGFFSTIQPDSGWISKYSRSFGLWGALRVYTMAPLLSASSSEADTRRMLVPMLASCLTFSTYF